MLTNASIETSSNLVPRFRSHEHSITVLSHWGISLRSGSAYRWILLKIREDFLKVESRNLLLVRDMLKLMFT